MPESRPHVTIIGAGVAGMSAALRLLEAGCPVTSVMVSRTFAMKY